MVGHIAGLGYSQRMSATGLPLNGCKLYVYDTGTSTPVTTYVDYALGTAHPHPIVADAAGIIPMFWVADGTYRVRLTDSDGNEIFDDDGIVAIGPSSGASSGTSVDANAIFDTGDFLWQPKLGTRTGWVRANARTIGSAASGATERANSDVEDLFGFLWNNFSNTLCPVTGGRGGSAAADWSANKVIALPDLRGKAAFGVDDMGNSAAGVIAAGTPTAISASGAETISHSHTIAGANLPSTTFVVTATASSHNHVISGSVANESAHTHTAGTLALNSLVIANGTNVIRTGNFQSNVPSTGGGGSNVPVDGSDYTLTVNSGALSGTASAGSAHTHTVGTLVNAAVADGTISVSGTAASGGSGTALTSTVNKMPPYYLGTWYVKI